MRSSPMKLSIMQPYFVPYLGYFQLIHASDLFVAYDDVQYPKGGWVNRNRILNDGKAKFISLPIRKSSLNSLINEKVFSNDFAVVQKKLLKNVYQTYRQAPYFYETYNLFEQIMNFKSDLVVDFVMHSITLVTKILSIRSKIILSSSIDSECDKHGVNRVIAISNNLNVSQYINAIGGLNLYDKEYFKKNGIELLFLKMKSLVYEQFVKDRFLENLSIIDVLMFNGISGTKTILNDYKLI